jgi:hypothetical protein
MRFADLDKLDAGRGEPEAVVRAWCVNASVLNVRVGRSLSDAGCNPGQPNHAPERRGSRVAMSRQPQGTENTSPCGRSV